MKTKEKLEQLEKFTYITKHQAGMLAETALREYSKRSRIAREIFATLQLVALGRENPNKVRSLTAQLVDYYDFRELEN